MAKKSTKKGGKNRTLKVLKQHRQSFRDKKKKWKWDKHRDEERGAKLPGRRRSYWGETYYETRVNRSDAPNSRL